ncbi:acyl-coenzyme A thioesterase 5-like [Grus japonensis]|uniref:Acyl-coenzyme A thioesterase 5-like n=1 Tax=Grus japonensis TaxID=30415 RepID=A0ABC9WYD5_GRUJA
MAPTICLSPATRSLFDEPLAITVQGLSPRQQVTLRTSLQDETGELFQACARYQAGDDGELDLARCPALPGGSFSGLEPMGLLWALQPQKPFRCMVKRDMQSPFVLQLEVFEGHGEPPGRLLAQAQHERVFLRDGVRRVPVREGRIRATLFLPPGEDTFPGIIDIHGYAGGLFEHRASLLANHGFATLALAYFKYEDLPQDPTELHLEYFEEAVNYMLQHPQVKGPGVGLLGYSKGAELSFAMAAFLKNITAVVSLNGPVANTIIPLCYKDKIIPPLPFNEQKVKVMDSDVIDCSEVLPDPFQAPGNQSLIPLEKAEAQLLLIAGQDDRVVKSEYYATKVCKLLQAQGKANFQKKPQLKRRHSEDSNPGAMGQVITRSLCQVNFRGWQKQLPWLSPVPAVPQHCSPTWIPRMTSAHSLSSMAPTIQLSPATRSLFDEPLAITVQGLSPRQQVTLRTSLQDETGELFQACARYQAGDDGELDLARCPALPGGSFSGLEPMGLLWALQPQKPFRRLVKRDVQSPFVLQLEVFEGHGEPPGRLLAQAQHERVFLRDGVRRVPVREGRIRATLFLPPGEDTFPGIIDIHGYAGGLFEHRASLLANHGFATLALAYFKYEDLPQDPTELHLEYFEEAVNYMLQHPQVKGPGVGLLGYSKGAELSLAMAAFLKNITAVVSLNGPVANTIIPLCYKDKIIPPLPFDEQKVKVMDSDVIDCSEVLADPFQAPGNQSLIPLEKAEAQLLLIAGQDDRVVKIMQVSGLGRAW